MNGTPGSAASTMLFEHRPDLTDEELRHLMKQARQTAALYDEYAPGDALENQRYRHIGANAYGPQTLSGLLLEFQHGVPCKLWTPLGIWRFAGIFCYHVDVAGFMSRLRIRPNLGRAADPSGHGEPVYPLLAIDGVELPEPVLVADKRQRLPAAAAHSAWARFYAAS